MEKAGYPLEQPFDFRVKGVTSISADTHKVSPGFLLSPRLLMEVTSCPGGWGNRTTDLLCSAQGWLQVLCSGIPPGIFRGPDVVPGIKSRLGVSKVCVILITLAHAKRPVSCIPWLRAVPFPLTDTVRGPSSLRLPAALRLFGVMGCQYCNPLENNSNVEAFILLIFKRQDSVNNVLWEVGSSVNWNLHFVYAGHPEQINWSRGGGGLGILCLL